jgi:drug/metabolite transporter (DMT)-like permease
VSAAAPAAGRAEAAGVGFGLLAVAAFSVTVPATRVAVLELDPLFVALGRALVAAACAALVLAATRQRVPERRHLAPLLVVAAGVVVGFPVLMAWAMRRVPSAHGAVLLGVLPAATAVAGVVRGRERPSAAFWAASLAGCGAVVAFALASGAGGLEPADLALLVAIALGALGYAEGARLAREIGAWQVICWALVLVAPLLAVPFAVVAGRADLDASGAAWAGVAYVSVVSQFLGFFAWYRGLALGGIARVGQTQLVQPFLTLLVSAALLGERVTPSMLAVAAVVVAAVAVAARARVLSR